MTSLLDALDSEWELMTRATRFCKLPTSWTDPALIGFNHPQAIVNFVQERGHPAANDDVFGPLLRLAAYDDVASRTVLQALMPGIKALVRRYQWADTRDEIASMAISFAFERIRHYPINRRPHRIAANILGDTRRGLYENLVGRSEPKTEMLGENQESAVPMSSRSAADSFGVVIRDAVQSGTVSLQDARLIVETRVFDVPVEAVARVTGAKPQSLRRRRLRAEARLKVAEITRIG